MAQDGKRVFENANYQIKDRDVQSAASSVQAGIVRCFADMESIMGRLEDLAQKELGALPFSEDEKKFLKTVIDSSGNVSGPPRYNGWYAKLFYRGGISAAEWEPTVADIHTDPESGKCSKMARSGSFASEITKLAERLSNISCRRIW